MVIATPFLKNKHFYYNQKINLLKVSGYFKCGNLKHTFKPDTYGVLDWGRGIWTYSNTWYWSSLNVKQGDNVIGWNLGYGFGDTSAASENMFFVNQDELGILIFENNNFENDSIRCKSSQYVYDYQSNTLYGNREETHLIEAFISPYYSWIGSDGKFDSENNGNYTYVYTEFPVFHDGY